MKPSSNFLVADKKDGLMGLYSKSGNLIDYYPIAVGRDSGKSEIFQGGSIGSWSSDTAGTSAFIDKSKRKITPSGVFEMKKQKYKNTGIEYIGDTNYDRTSRQQFAVHSAFSPTNMPLNYISNGCILPSKGDMRKILTNIGDETIVAVLPNKGRLATDKITKYDPRPKKSFGWF